MNSVVVTLFDVNHVDPVAPESGTEGHILKYIVICDWIEAPISKYFFQIYILFYVIQSHHIT